MANTALVWQKACHEQKQRLLRVLFPAGIEFSNGAFGTAVTCIAFSTMGRELSQNASLQ